MYLGDIFLLVNWPTDRDWWTTLTEMTRKKTCKLNVIDIRLKKFLWNLLRINLVQVILPGDLQKTFCCTSFETTQLGHEQSSSNNC